MLAIREDTSCRQWIPIGTIALRPETSEAKNGEPDPYEAAVQFGGYEWAYPNAEKLIASARSAIDNAAAVGSTSTRNDQASDDHIRRALEHLPYVACRVGLLQPYIDAKIASLLPLRRPTTLVMDTSAILQGGLDFAVRFLCPAARIRIPAVAHMELLSQTDNYFKIRRKSGGKNTRGRALLERACGIGGQRALIRVERSNEIEIERATIGADPLRGIVRIDEEDKALGLEYVQRSFADRLIFETAREHQTRCSTGHRVMLVTADEGLSRMTIGEGMWSFLVRAPKPSDVSEMILPGTCFQPFKSELYAVPLPLLLWELAVTFGAARLASSTECFEIRAIGEDLPWRPFHTMEDLLWTKSGPLPVEEPPGQDSKAESGARNDNAPSKTIPNKPGSKSGKTKPAEEVSGDREPEGGSAYKFSFKRMVHLVGLIAEKRVVSIKDAFAAIEIPAERVQAEFRNFLITGGFIKVEGDNLNATELLDELWNALRSLDMNSLERLLARVPSVKTFFDCLKKNRSIRETSDLPISKRAFSTYSSLAEVCAVGMTLVDEGLYATDNDPTPEDFVAVALSAFNSVSKGEALASTGAWLEELVRKYAIHPIRAREKLEAAWKAGLIERYVEGSSPDTSYEKHGFWMLTLESGSPAVNEVKLYHGNFLIPERASVSLRVRRKGAP